MANTTVQTANRVEQWDSNFFSEYVRAQIFSKYMGTSQNSVIQVKEQLGKSPGDKITVSLVRALSGAGVTGSTTLEGNEESLLNYGHQLTVDALRNGVRVDKMEEQKTAIDLRNAGKMALKEWAMSKLRSAIIAAMLSPNVDGKTAYASTAEATKDTWLTANADRVLAGALKSNTSSLDHSTSLANIDNTADKLTPGMISLAKRMARTATNRAVRPVMVDSDGEWFVLFAQSLAFRDLKNNATMVAAHQYAMERGKNNPLWTDGDLIWDGVVIREIPEIPILTGVGAGAIDVAPNFLCGAQALGVAWAQRTKSIVETFDYGFQYGVAIEEIRGVEKLTFNNVQNGLVTMYTAGVADS